MENSTYKSLQHLFFVDFIIYYLKCFTDAFNWIGTERSFYLMLYMPFYQA